LELKAQNAYQIASSFMMSAPGAFIAVHHYGAMQRQPSRDSVRAASVEIKDERCSLMRFFV
jgi:hypothetical protein